MTDIEFSESVAELLAILDNNQPEYVEKIPKKVMDFFREHAAKDYEIKFDPNDEIKNMNLKPGTKGLLSLIYLDYWANKDEKIEFQKILYDNNEKLNKILTENMFKNRKLQSSVNSNLPSKDESEKKLSTVKETVWIKSIRKIKKLVENLNFLKSK